MSHRRNRALCALVAVLLVPLASADTIHLKDGKTINDVKVTKDGIKQVTYKDGRRDKPVKSENILRIEFEGKPKLVDRAETAVDDGQFLAAIADFETYVQGHFASGRKARPVWAPAYALNRLIELNSTIGDLEQVIFWADEMIAKAPDSRHLPGAYLAKATAQYLNKKGSKALKTLNALEAKVQTEGLSRRWTLEVELGQVVLDDSIKAKARRTKLAGIATSAGSLFPLVKSRALVAEAESLLTTKKYSEAESILQKIVNAGVADPATLAAANTGLGECLFQRGVAAAEGGAERADLLKHSLMSFMRVVVVYKNESRYVPKAMFYAGRVFDLAEDEISKERAQKLYRRVMRDYQGSHWADQANGFRK